MYGDAVHQCNEGGLSAGGPIGEVRRTLRPECRGVAGPTAMQNNSADKQVGPLNRLNLVSIPTAIVLAATAASFWRGMAIAAAIGAVAGAVLGYMFIQKLARELAAMKQQDPLSHLRYSIELQGTPKGRFVVMQATSGGLVGAVWFVLAFGIASLW